MLMMFRCDDHLIQTWLWILDGFQMKIRMMVSNDGKEVDADESDPGN